MKNDSSLKSIQAMLNRLTHADLREWAGSKIYNRGKGYVKEVSQIKSLLASKTRDELQALVVELAVDFPEVFRRLRDTMRLETGQVDQLVRSLRKEIRHLASEEAWYNPWKGEGSLARYGKNFTI